MNASYKKLLGVLCSVALITLILDTQTTIIAAEDGIKLCFRSIIPSLFPFILISNLFTTFLSDASFPTLSKLCKPLGMPVGGESLFLLGLLSGYPVGAQNINSAYKNKTLSRKAACRMLGFCSNAGPSFIFGILGPMFENKVAPWCLWAIHIASAIIVGIVIPGKECNSIRLPQSKEFSFSKSMDIALRSVASICGWVIIFRIVIAFLQKTLLTCLPFEVSVIVSGLLELSNGCLLLYQLPSEGIRFILASLILGTGGLCVAMQTASVTSEVGMGMYFPGKALQASISVCLASLVQLVLFSREQVCFHWMIILIISLPLTFIFLLHIKLKNKCSFLNKTVV